MFLNFVVFVLGGDKREGCSQIRSSFLLVCFALKKKDGVGKREG